MVTDGMNTTALIEELEKTASQLESMALDPNTKVASESTGASISALGAGSAFIQSLATSLGLEE